MSTRTPNTATSNNTAISNTAGPRPSAPPTKPAQLSVARQVRQQRRGYATAVLRTLARTHRGRPDRPDPGHPARQPHPPGHTPDPHPAARARDRHRRRSTRRAALTHDDDPATTRDGTVKRTV